MKLKGKTALVTGGGSGIGREISLTFAREGASVAVNDINPDSIQAVIKEMGENGEKAFSAVADVSKSDQVKKMFEEISKQFGSLDILVNNAGIGESGGQTEMDKLNKTYEAQLAEVVSGLPVKTFLNVTQNMEDETWDKMLKVHLYGTFYCTREALKLMLSHNWGRIINISSVAATMGLEGAPHYSAAKAGILGFTRSVAREVGSRGINVNAIAPGYIETPMTEPLSPVLRKAWVSATALKKPGRTKDIAGAALYLASEDGDFVAGQIISPNGGAWIQ